MIGGASAFILTSDSDDNKDNESETETTYYTIQASATTGGNISPSGQIEVAEGESKTFTFTPDTDYELSHIMVDGKRKEVSGSSYTFSNVSKNHTISAVFEKAYKPVNPSQPSAKPTKYVVGMEVKGKPGTQYLFNPFNAGDMTVTLKYSDGTQKVTTDYDVSPADFNKEIGPLDVLTISYMGFEKLFENIEVEIGPETPISTFDELQYFAQLVNTEYSFSGKTVYLTSDIDMSRVSNWTPIGTASKPFQGTFDGMECIISELKVDVDSGYAGLFGYIENGSVTNLKIDGASIKGVDCVGVIAGSIKNTDFIDKCIVSNANVYGNHYVGGIIGYGYGAITNCVVSESTITAEPNDLGNGYDNGDKVGGIIGWHSNGNITGNTAIKVNITAYRDVGGIVGYTNAEDNDLTVSGNKASDITITIDRSKNAGYHDINAGEIIGRKGVSNKGFTVTVEDNSENNVNIVGPTYIWDGNTPVSKPDSLIVDTENKLISIWDDKALAYFDTFANDSDFYNKYGSKWQYSVELNADINLNGEAWKPITLSNFVSFEGNNHTIHNLDVRSEEDNVGFFATVSCNDIGVTYVRNLTVNGAHVEGNHKVGALAGSSPQGAFLNVTVNEAILIGNKYVGGIFGGGNGSVNDSTVMNSTIIIRTDTHDHPGEGTIVSKEAGGLIGYLSNDGKPTGENKIISGNTVENVTITAPTIAAGLVSQPNSSNTGSGKIIIENNKLLNVKVYASDSSASLYVSNNVGDKSIVRNNTSDDLCEAGAIYSTLKLIPKSGDNRGTIIVSDKEGLLKIPELGTKWVELFSDGEGTSYSNYPVKNYYYSWTWSIELTSDIDFENQPINPINLGKKFVFDGQGHTIRNAVITTDNTTENAAGLFIADQCGVSNLKLDNIHVTGSNVGGSTAGVLSGSCTKPINNVEISNSSVTNGKYTGGIVGYGYTSIIGCTLDNVEVKGGYKCGGIIGYICADTGKTNDVTGNTLTDCTVDGLGDGNYAGGKNEYIIGKVVGNYNCNGTCNDNTITGMTTSSTENIGEIEAGKVVTEDSV